MFMRKEIFQDYEEILMNRRSLFPRRYFDYSRISNQDLALSVIRYAIEVHLKWSPREAVARFTPEIAKKLKLDMVLKHIEFPCDLERDNYLYIVHLLYPKQVPFDLKQKILDMYHRSKDHKARYPKAYNEGEMGRIRACICLQDALQNQTFHSIREIYALFSSPVESMRFLKREGLYAMYTAQFDYPLAYLHASLPDVQKDTDWYAYFSFRYFVSKQVRAMRKAGTFVI